MEEHLRQSWTLKSNSKSPELKKKKKKMKEQPLSNKIILWDWFDR